MENEWGDLFFYGFPLESFTLAAWLAVSLLRLRNFHTRRVRCLVTNIETSRVVTIAAQSIRSIGRRPRYYRQNLDSMAAKRPYFLLLISISQINQGTPWLLLLARPGHAESDDYDHNRSSCSQDMNLSIAHLSLAYTLSTYNKMIMEGGCKNSRIHHHHHTISVMPLPDRLSASSLVRVLSR